jgi:hypothetical protein
LTVYCCKRPRQQKFVFTKLCNGGVRTVSSSAAQIWRSSTRKK